MNYDKIDWAVEKPTLDACDACWASTGISWVQPTNNRLSAVIEALENTHVNGGARVAQFQVDSEGAVFWFLSRNRLDEMRFFDRFFCASPVIQAFPEISTPNPRVSEFKMEGCFVAIGHLAQILSNGGAYKNLMGRDSETWRLALEFAEGAFGGRFSTTMAWVNWSAWSPYFFDVAWDATLFFFDKTEGVMTVLTITDTD